MNEETSNKRRTATIIEYSSTGFIIENDDDCKQGGVSALLLASLPFRFQDSGEIHILTQDLLYYLYDMYNYY